MLVLLATALRANATMGRPPTAKGATEAAVPSATSPPWTCSQSLSMALAAALASASQSPALTAFGSRSDYWQPKAGTRQKTVVGLVQDADLLTEVGMLSEHLMGIWCSKVLARVRCQWEPLAMLRAWWILMHATIAATTRPLLASPPSMPVPTVLFTPLSLGAGGGLSLATSSIRALASRHWRRHVLSALAAQLVAPPLQQGLTPQIARAARRRRVRALQLLNVFLLAMTKDASSSTDSASDATAHGEIMLGARHLLPLLLAIAGEADKLIAGAAVSVLKVLRCVLRCVLASAAPLSDREAPASTLQVPLQEQVKPTPSRRSTRAATAAAAVDSSPASISRTHEAVSGRESVEISASGRNDAAPPRAKHQSSELVAVLDAYLAALPTSASVTALAVSRSVTMCLATICMPLQRFSSGSVSVWRRHYTPPGLRSFLAYLHQI